MEFVKFLDQYRKTIPQEKLDAMMSKQQETSVTLEVDTCVNHIVRCSRLVRDRYLYVKHLATTFKWENVNYRLTDEEMGGLLRLWLQLQLKTIPSRQGKISFLDQVTLHACSFVFH